MAVAAEGMALSLCLCVSATRCGRCDQYLAVLCVPNAKATSESCHGRFDGRAAAPGSFDGRFEAGRQPATNLVGGPQHSRWARAATQLARLWNPTSAHLIFERRMRSARRPSLSLGPCTKRGARERRNGAGPGLERWCGQILACKRPGVGPRESS